MPDWERRFMSSPDRQELVRNAVAFLQDPKSQGSPLAQKIQFLEAKGLNPQEIEIAIRQSSLNQTVAGPSYAAYPGYGNAYPPAQNWDWRDYFITAVVSGTLAYGAVSLFKKYVSPHLQPPSSTAYEADRDELTAQFDAAEALLKDIQAESAAIRAAVDEQTTKVDKATKDVQDVVAEMREGESKTRDSMREVREEITSIRDMLPKMIDKSKEAQTQSLAEIQHELKSLKALLMSRGPTIPSQPSSPLPTLGRPSIPAWQLAAGSTGSAINGKPTATPSPPPLPATNSSAPSSDTTVVNGNGKGKEVDTSSSTE